MDDTLFHAYLDHVRRTHARQDHQTDFRTLAARLGITVAVGRTNYAALGDPPVISLTPWEFGQRRNFTGMHEIAHLLMQECGVEAALIREHGTLEEALPTIEAMTNFAAGLLLMPAPLMREALDWHGRTAMAVFHLWERSPASLGAALRRFVFDDLEARVAAFTTSGSYIADVAACNTRLPFWRYDRVPEIGVAMPDANLMRLTPGRVLGVVAW